MTLAYNILYRVRGNFNFAKGVMDIALLDHFLRKRKFLLCRKEEISTLR